MCGVYFTLAPPFLVVLVDSWQIPTKLTKIDKNLTWGRNEVVFIPCSFLAHSWFIPGLFLVISWSISGSFRVYSWLIPGSLLAHYWHLLLASWHIDSLILWPFHYSHLCIVKKYQCIITDSFKTCHNNCNSKSQRGSLKSLWAELSCDFGVES